MLYLERPIRMSALIEIREKDNVIKSKDENNLIKLNYKFLNVQR